MQDWQKAMIDRGTADPKKRALIVKIVKKQGFTAPNTDGTTIEGMIEGDVNALAFGELITNLGAMSVTKLREVLKMDPVPA